MTSPFTHPLPVSLPTMAAVVWPGSCSAADLFSARFRAIFLARYGDQPARENNHVVNSGGLLTRWSLALIKPLQKSLSGLTQAFRLLSCVFRHDGEGNERNVPWVTSHMSRVAKCL